ncbi:hypothetical protein CBL_02787 [Carabus blaptoides fortunei]
MIPEGSYSSQARHEVRRGADEEAEISTVFARPTQLYSIHGTSISALKNNVTFGELHLAQLTKIGQRYKSGLCTVLTTADEIKFIYATIKIKRYYKRLQPTLALEITLAVTLDLRHEQ